MTATAELIRVPQESKLTISQLTSNMEELRDVMRSVMVAEQDYGVIPGTKSKPTLLKPGGEKLAMMFRLAPEFIETVTKLDNDHREYQVKCRLTHMPTGNFVGEASAVCSTMESKYRYRGGARKCPMCGKEAIKKSKFPPRDQPQAQPGFYCFAKVGGCGANFTHDDPDIVGQSEVKTENPDIADQYNTVKQIAQKRAFLSAIKTATASSELFTIDVGDPENEHDAPDDRRPLDPAAAKDRRNQAASGEENQDTQRREPPKQQPKPDLSKEFTELRDAIYRMGVPSGNLEHANAVVNYGYEGATIQKCSKDAALSKQVYDGLLNRGASGITDKEIYQDALKSAGLLVEQTPERAPDDIPY